jgi:dethiobiotin synthetase
MKGFFITATGTDIGKTWVCRMIAECLSERGITVAYCKPVQTGCELLPGGTLSAPDFEFVKASGALTAGEADECSPYRFAPAVSPHLAARMADIAISVDRIEASVQKLANRAGCVLVEGAGGLYAPLANDVYIIDIAARLGLPVLLVCSPGLGTLNHTVLSVRALKERGVSLAGCVINNKDGLPADDMYLENCRFIKSFAAPAKTYVLDRNTRVCASSLEFCDEFARTWL